jgi:hypothetical protein
MQGINGRVVLFAGSSRSSRLVEVIESGDMPRDEKEVTSEQLDMLKKWIDQGANFDGPNPMAKLQSVADLGLAANISHEELFRNRQQRALERWQRVLPNTPAVTAIRGEVFVLSGSSQERTDEVLETINSAIEKVKRDLDVPEDTPMFRGGLTAFAFRSRYDYSEFGRMTEVRELPKDWLGHWRADSLDVYSVLLAEPDGDDEQLEAVAMQTVVAAYLGSFLEVPYWFAEGVARSMVAATYRREDARVHQWQQSLPAAQRKLASTQTLLEGKLDEESAGLIGMSLTTYMMDRTRRRRFDLLLEGLRQGKTFEEACTAAFVAPSLLVKGWLGK